MFDYTLLSPSDFIKLSSRCMDIVNMILAALNNKKQYNPTSDKRNDTFNVLGKTNTLYVEVKKDFNIKVAIDFCLKYCMDREIKAICWCHNDLMQWYKY